MKLKQLITDNRQALTKKYGRRLLPGHRKALDAILACRSHCGEFQVACGHCETQGFIPLSCGHRSCPQCQNHLSQGWLEKQRQKLLPVEYFMVTFTLPQELRTVAWQHQSIMYDLLFKASVEALKTVGVNNHGIELAMTGVLHTHKRDKGFHPHVHFIVPGGGIACNKKKGQFKKLNEKFLINEMALAQVFRGIFLRLFFEQALPLPTGLPKKWIAHVASVGKGEKALKYLSRYLYRGVISENDIDICDDGQVKFSYRESKTNHIKTKVLAPEDFIWRILQHVLPRGFRRVRDYGFLHGNARLMLKRIQLILHVKLSDKQPEKIGICCRQCLQAMEIIAVMPKRIPMLFRFYPARLIQKPRYGRPPPSI